MKTDEIYDLSDADWEYMHKKWGVTDREVGRTIWRESQVESVRKMQELFGDCEFPPEDELEIIDSDLPHEKKVAQLQKLRAEKLKKDRIHAKGLGVLLD